MTQSISPTPGRILWYTPAPAEGLGQLSGQPLAAIVVGVHSDSRVNLSVFDTYGNNHSRTNVFWRQPGEDKPAPGYAFAEWMPYQVGAAAKAEQVEQTIARTRTFGAAIGAPEGHAATGVVLTEGDAQADLDGTQRPDNHGKSSWSELAGKWFGGSKPEASQHGTPSPELDGRFEVGGGVFVAQGDVKSGDAK